MLSTGTPPWPVEVAVKVALKVESSVMVVLELRLEGTGVETKGLAWVSRGVVESGLGILIVGDDGRREGSVGVEREVGEKAGEVGRLAVRLPRPLVLKVGMALGGTMGAVRDEAMLAKLAIGVATGRTEGGWRTSRMTLAQWKRSSGRS